MVDSYVQAVTTRSSKAGFCSSLILVMIVNLFVDLMYSLINPRIRQALMATAWHTPN